MRLVVAWTMSASVWAWVSSLFVSGVAVGSASGVAVGSGSDVAWGVGMGSTCATWMLSPAALDMVISSMIELLS